MLADKRTQSKPFASIPLALLWAVREEDECLRHMPLRYVSAAKISLGADAAAACTMQFLQFQRTTQRRRRQNVEATSS